MAYQPEKTQSASEPSEEAAVTDLDDDAILQFATQLLTAPAPNRRRSSPEKTSSIELLELDDSSWVELYERFAMHDRFGVIDLSSNAPWRRCLILLRSYGARACIVEHDYVCLDHRSEISAFYSNLDEPTEFSPIRLHFFAAELADSALQELQSADYLGYIVLRSEGLPPVGRAMLRPPDEGTFACAVESVNLLGQKLQVEGMPFMQQDTRFATCAHASVWGIFYSAFRRGMSQRHLISDIVNSLADRSVAQPIVPDGLRPDQVQLLFQRGGMGAELHHLPAQQIGFGEVRKSALPDADAARFDHAFSEFESLHAACAEVEKTGALGYSLPAPETLDPTERAKHFVRESAAIIEGLSDRALPSKVRVRAASLASGLPALVDALARDFARPYLESRFPIYCHTTDHAMILCGLSAPEGDVSCYFHDDQYGPYLRTSSVTRANRQDFRTQSAMDEFVDSDADVLSVGRAWALASPQTNAGGSTRYVEVMVVPTPRRVLLAPVAARNDLLRIVEESTGAIQDQLKDTIPADLVEVDADHRSRLRVILMMGIDYKRKRREQLAKVPAARTAYSGVHLAEWVVVVEQLDVALDASTKTVVSREFVYDASSANDRPRLQLVRIGGEFRTRGATGSDFSWPSDGTSVNLPGPVPAPSPTGKVH